MSSDGGTRRIETGYLARVEGEGAMHVRVRGEEVLDVELRIFEPPRLFEALLRGRALGEAPDITARICGICPVAYQTSACQAMEDALGIEVEGQLRTLRRLIYCGEWVESHALHLYMLHAPDFLGYESGFAMARDHREVVERGLRAKKTGNRLIEAGRRDAPYTRSTSASAASTAPRSGASWRRCAPSWSAVATRRWRRCAGPPASTSPSWSATTSWSRCAPRSRASTRSTAGGSSPRRGSTSRRPSSTRPSRRSTSPTRPRCTRGSADAAPTWPGRWPASASTSTASRRSPPTAAREAGIGEGCRNPFRSIIVRAVEILYAFDEALRLLDAYQRPDAPAVEFEPRAAVGHGVSEAPRGLLYHRYEIDDAGQIVSARIVPPTSQNQRSIEDDLREFVAANLALPDEELRDRCEQTIRNYDPCISCSTHFLRLEVERE